MRRDGDASLSHGKPAILPRPLDVLPGILPVGRTDIDEAVFRHDLLQRHTGVWTILLLWENSSEKIA